MESVLIALAMQGCAVRQESASVRFDDCSPSLRSLVNTYVDLLALPVNDLHVTTVRATFARWIGRSAIPTRYGGAYSFVRRTGAHCVLINLHRIDTEQPRAIEIVVAEELIHMRDQLDGDTRRHAKHGHDRIAGRVALLVGVSLDELRSVLLPINRQSYRYLYQCPGCGLQVRRKRRGTWSCPRCSRHFDPHFVLTVVTEHDR